MQESKKVYKISLSDIIIGERVRKDHGDLENLALSLHVEGQLEPIVLSEAGSGKYHLLEGERRIKAAKINGWHELDAILFEEMPLGERKKLELIMCVQKKSLSYVEEARAVRDLLEVRKKEQMSGGLAKRKKVVKQKDIALELNISESRMSEDVLIANNLDDHPELEAKCLSRSECLKRIRKQEFFVHPKGALRSIYEESFVIANSFEALDLVGKDTVSLAFLNMKDVDLTFLQALKPKLRTSAQILLFCPFSHVSLWQEILQEEGFHLEEKPHVWYIKGESDTQNFLWAGKNRRAPTRYIPPCIAAGRPKKPLSNVAKPRLLMDMLVKSTSERGDFVFIPECFGIEAVQCCVESERQVLAANADKVIRDRCILSLIERKET